MTQKFIIENISPTSSRIQYGEKTIILLGTAHVSVKSRDEVKTHIQNEKPEHVCVELDADRLKNLDEKRKWSATDISDVLKKGKGFMLLANLALTAFQRRMSMDKGIQPGAEMKEAVELCRENNIPFTCADRSIQVTLSRAWRLSNLWIKLKMLSTLLASVFSREVASTEEIETLKTGDAMQSMMQELAQYLPSVKNVLIDERDYYLASKIINTPANSIMAVVGAAHVPGIVKHLQKFMEGSISTDISDINRVPPKKWYSKTIPWLIPIAIAITIAAGFFYSGPQKGLHMSLVWILANGIMASLGAILALAHPLTILISFIGAPITSLNPTIGVGMVSGLLQYLLRTPRVFDMENLYSDILSIKGWYKNRVTKILLVFFFSSLGSSVGTFIAIPWLTKIISNQ